MIIKRKISMKQKKTVMHLSVELVSKELTSTKIQGSDSVIPLCIQTNVSCQNAPRFVRP